MAIAFAAQLLCTCTAKEDLASMPDVCSSSGGSRACDPQTVLDAQLLQFHSAEARKAECSASQKGKGCCEPLGDTASAWVFESLGVHGTWSGSPTFIRFDFEDDQICGGPANARQHGSATLTTNDVQTISLTLSMEGVAESQYEYFELYVDGTREVKVQAQNGHGGSACQVSTCIMCDVSMPQQSFSLAPGQHTILVEVDSRDGLYHLGCYFQIAFSKTSPECGGCTCTASTPSPTPAPTAAPTPSPTPSPTPAPTAAPTPSPTPSPTPAPTPAPTAAPASILNDPHVASLGGDRFDINQPAEYVLLRAPLEESQPALLELRGLVKPAPARPCGLYVKAATLGGAWFGKAIAQVRPLEQSAAGSIGWPFSLQVSGGPWKSVADFAAGNSSETLTGMVKIIAEKREEYGGLAQGQAFTFHIGKADPPATISISQAAHQGLNIEMANMQALGYRALGGLLGTEKHSKGVEELTEECRAQKASAVSNLLATPERPRMSASWF